MKLLCKVLVAALILLLPGMASAIGLGDLKLQSRLNEPLLAEFNVLNPDGQPLEELSVGLAPKADFENHKVEYSEFLNDLEFELYDREDGSSYVRLSSWDPVREPYLHLLVEARWPAGRIVRMYTVLLDTAEVAAIPEPADTGEVADPPVAADLDQSDSAAEILAELEASLGEPLTPGSQYLVRRAETLWSIASRLRSPGRTVQDTMSQILQANPQAFVEGDINRLMAGFRLQLPVVSGSETTLEAADGFDGGGVGDRLQILGVGDANSVQLEQLRRDNVDLLGRISAIEEQLQTLQSLLSLKDEQIEQLQAALARAEAAAGIAAETVSTALTGAQQPSEYRSASSPATLLGRLQEGRYLAYGGLAVLVIFALVLLLRWSRSRDQEKTDGESDEEEPFDLWHEEEVADDTAAGEDGDEAASGAAGDSDVADHGVEEADDDLVVADDADEVASKLDLAQAYEEMGETERARNLLEEVLKEGDADQQREARRRLDSIA